MKQIDKVTKMRDQDAEQQQSPGQTKRKDGFNSFNDDASRSDCNYNYLLALYNIICSAKNERIQKCIICVRKPKSGMIRAHGLSLTSGKLLFSMNKNGWGIARWHCLCIIRIFTSFLLMLPHFYGTDYNKKDKTRLNNRLTYVYFSLILQLYSVKRNLNK